MCIEHARARRFSATSVGLIAAHADAVARRVAKGASLDEFDRKALAGMSDLLRTVEKARADPLTGVRATPEAMLLIDVAGRLPLGGNDSLDGFRARSSELVSVVDKHDAMAAQSFVSFASALCREAGSNGCSLRS
ncbi:hypothetical protein [Candidatus Poriferisodalis sp.]|uniref:hypothetical protein n=1 Tax=Candidatus Poriferisodalis sp. TaxID=3101277 RepID=UPI003D0B9691